MAPALNSRLDDITTTHADFRRYSKADHALPILPQNNRLFSNGQQFSDRTTNQETYKKFEFQPAAMPQQSRNHSLPPWGSSRNSEASAGDPPKPRSRFATRTTNMDAYASRDAATETGSPVISAKAAGLSSSMVNDGKLIFHDNPRVESAQNMTNSSICPAELLLAGKGAWNFAGKDHGHDYYNLESA